MTHPVEPSRIDSKQLARQALESYSEDLRRSVANKLLRPRNTWPTEELLDRAIQALDNAVLIDRRLKEMSVPAQQLLIMAARTGRATWRIQEWMWCLGFFTSAPDIEPILEMLQSGLIFPNLAADRPELKEFAHWFLEPATRSWQLFLPNEVAERARSLPLQLPKIPWQDGNPHHTMDCDGLDWPLRMGVLWQQVHQAPMRLTQSGEFFKRDLQRLQTDATLNAPLLPGVNPPVDQGILAVELARAMGILTDVEGELRAGKFPASWQGDYVAQARSHWQGMLSFDHWDPLLGYQVEMVPLASNLLMLSALLLAEIPEGNWATAKDLVNPILDHHAEWRYASSRYPNKQASWLEAVFLALPVPMRFFEAAQFDGDFVFRLSPLGREMLRLSAQVSQPTRYPQTLVVQPNSEILVYRQALTTGLIDKLTRFADWKTLGAACMMVLNAESVYRGLESGMTFDGIVQLLRQISMHEVPPNVIDSIKRWSLKRDRITVYAAATLLEFNTAEELEKALNQGLVTRKLTDRIGLSESQDIDYKQFRLIANRDYESKPQQCIHFQEDGVRFEVDVTRSDLMLEAELTRLAEPRISEVAEKRAWELTQASLRRAMSLGYRSSELETWFQERAGIPLSPSTRLLMVGSNGKPVQASLLVVVQVFEAIVADGLMQWPATRDLIQERIGPTAMIVKRESLEPLQGLLNSIGIPFEMSVH
jgi:hypothetical protein